MKKPGARGQGSGARDKPAVLAGLLALLTSAASVEAAAEGEAVYRQHCAACHDRGIEHPGTARLGDRYPTQASLLDREALPSDFVRIIVRRGLNLMPAFRPAELGDEELQALGAFLDAGPHPANGEQKK